MVQLKTYNIEITEILQKQIKVKAENKDDALQQVHEDYDSGKIVLTADDITNLSINLCP